MGHLYPEPNATFRWYIATISMSEVMKQYGPIDAQDDTAESVQLVLAQLNRALFTDDFSEARVKALSEDQIAEWMRGVLRAWQQGITGYLPETCNPNTAEVLPIVLQAARASYCEKEVQRQRENANRNKPQFACVWAALRELKVSSVFVDFSGEGDSGEITAIEPKFDVQSSIVSELELQEMVTAFRSKILMQSNTVPIKLEDLIEELSHQLLCRDEIPDWYNDDGGNGTLEWRANPDGSNMLHIMVDQCVRRYNTTVLICDGSGEAIDMLHEGLNN